MKDFNEFQKMIEKDFDKITYEAAEIALRNQEDHEEIRGLNDSAIYLSVMSILRRYHEWYGSERH